MEKSVREDGRFVAGLEVRAAVLELRVQQVERQGPGARVRGKPLRGAGLLGGRGLERGELGFDPLTQARHLSCSLI